MSSPTKHFLPECITKGVRAIKDGFEYGEWYKLRFTAYGVAKTLDEAMLANGMSLTTVEDRRPAWLK